MEFGEEKMCASSDTPVVRRTVRRRAGENRGRSLEHTAGGGKMIPTGCSLLNLALSNDVRGGYQSGRLVNLIGDSHAGKSILALTGLAEVANNPLFDDYLLLYDDVERAMSFDIRRLFGQKLLSRLEEAWEEERGDSDEYEPPATIQEFYARALGRCQTGRPFIQVLDSFDALSTTEELTRAEDLAKKGKETGSYKMEKARWASEAFRVLSRTLCDTESLIIIVSQTRDNIDPIGFQKKTRAGGKALEFYSSYIFWLAKMKSLTQGEGAKKVKTGRQVMAKITKTKTTGWEGSVQFPIYRQIGVDEVGAAVDFLCEHHSGWKKGTTVQCEELGLKGYRMAVCRQIEEQSLLPRIRKQLQEAWNDFMESSKIDRTCRFSDSGD